MPLTLLHRLQSCRSIRLLTLCLLAFAPSMLKAQSVIQGINWFPIGPADYQNGQTNDDGRVHASGRASVIAVNPANSNDVWLGTAGGGVWHSTNGGLNWLPMSDNEASLAIGSIALDGCSASGCAVIYLGTGENGIRRDTYYGMGLLVGSTSGGEFPTFGWNLVGADIFKYASITNVILDPSTSGGSKVVYVSVSSGVTASATESTVTAPAPAQGYGIFKSSNQGSSWTHLTVPGSGTARSTDLVIDPQSNTTLYAGFLGKGIFKTTDGGAHWCPLNSGIALPPGCIASTGLPNPATTTFDSVRLAIRHPSAAIPAVLYAVLGNCPDPVGNGPVFGGYCTSPLYQTTDGGATWTQVNSAVPTGFSRYHQALTIDPGNAGTVYFGGLVINKSIDNGHTFNEMGANVHPDHHDLVFPDPSNLSRIYDASDGGFSFSSDGGNTWSSGNSDLQISEFQSLSFSPLTARIIGGTQDNGTEMWVGTRLWNHADDGDSASTVMDRDDVMMMFDNYVSVDPRESTDGGGCCDWPGILNGLNTSDPAAFYAPVVEAAAAPHNLYFGSNLLYRSTDKGNTWATVSPVLGGTTPFYPDIGVSNVITAIAVAPSNGNRIYVGYYDGQMFVTNSACTTAACWTAIGGPPKGLPNAPITRIAVDLNNADVAYATYSGFSAGPHLYKTTNGGGNWIPANTGLPGIPTNTITVENNTTLWAGTDDGVYLSTNSGGSWIKYGTGLPHVPVYEIALDTVRGRLYAGTHGRGAFIITQPLLSNFEGWVNNDIWDIPVFGSGFVGTLANPVGSACTMQIIQQNGAVCATSTTDAMGGTISFDGSGSIVTSKGGFYNGRDVAWACFNGSCIGGKTIAQCNPPGNPITSVAVTCGGEVGIDHILGCPAQANPPSSVLGLSGMPAGGPAPSGPGPAPATPESEPLPAANFDVIPAVQGRNGVQALCTANVALQPGTKTDAALLKTRDVVNSTPSCQQNGVKAEVRGIPPEPQRGEDLQGSPPNLRLHAPTSVGGQLFTAIHAAAGSATNTCFDVSEIGSPLRNQVAVMKVDLETAPGGAAGGDVTVRESSSLGSCTAKVHTDPGETATQVVSDLAKAFQAPGVPGPAACPASQNPRDITPDGTSIISVLASELRVCNSDRNMGILIGPKELPNIKTRALQYSAKFVCGPVEKEKDHDWFGKRDYDDTDKKDHDKDKDKKDYDKDNEHGRGQDQMASGRYYTVINVHNPTERPAAIRVKFAVALADGKPGPISRYLDVQLGPDQVISINCAQIHRWLETNEEFLDGFAVLESDVELDVVAVYTAAGEHGDVQTLHTERVPARLQQ
jgi:photosystem II stability/assembly factor-like uncharacterized protein